MMRDPEREDPTAQSDELGTSVPIGKDPTGIIRMNISSSSTPMFVEVHERGPNLAFKMGDYPQAKMRARPWQRRYDPTPMERAVVCQSANEARAQRLMALMGRKHCSPARRDKLARRLRYLRTTRPRPA